RIFKRKLNRGLENVGFIFLVANEWKLFAVGHRPVQIDVRIKDWRPVFGFDQQRQYRGLIANGIVEPSRSNVGAGFEWRGKFYFGWIAQGAKNNLVENIGVRNQLPVKTASILVV